MPSRFGAASLVPVIAIAGLIGVGAAGYRLATGNCPLSCLSCDGDSKNAVVNVSETTDGGCDLCPSSKAQLVAQQAASSECCASKAACESEMACDSEGAAGTTKTVAHESGAASECGGKACKEGKDGCTGDGKNGCCGNCSEKKAEKSESMATSGR
jgi:hypothetical protein